MSVQQAVPAMQVHVGVEPHEAGVSMQ